MSQEQSPRLSTGVAGLDEILDGGLIPQRAYLVRGGPGTGKTTLGLHFLTAGTALGQKALFITLEETEAKVRDNAARLGFDLSGVTFLDLSPTSEFFAQIQTYDIFSAAEVEREPVTQKIVEYVQSLQPARVFLDPLTQFRYLSSDLFQFRKQVLSFLRFLVEEGATVLFTSEDSPDMPDNDLQFMADGIIHLEFSAAGRTLNVSKLRGSSFKGARHSIRLTGVGMQVFPRLMPLAEPQQFSFDPIPAGVPELDELLNGGLERGTVTMLTGPSGVGKTTLGLQFMKEAAGRGERSVVFSFEEEVEVILRRCESVNIPVRAMQKQGTLLVQKIEPLQFTPDEFARLTSRQVEQEQARVIMIDSVAGYRLCIQGEDLVGHLHALTKYLQNMGVVVILITETSNVVGDFQVTDVGISYLADNIIFLRYLEMQGEMRKAIGVLKKRLSDFEKTLREFEITRYGIKVGRPLSNLRGILSGTPTWISKEEQYE